MKKRKTPTKNQKSSSHIIRVEDPLQKCSSFSSEKLPDVGSFVPNEQKKEENLIQNPRLASAHNSLPEESKLLSLREAQSKTTMLFAAFFLGAIGLHRLLMGYKNWWLMLITLGGFGVWTLIDIVRIGIGRLPMANGQPLEK